MTVKTFLIFFFLVKFSLDFISPMREANFLILNAICIMFLFFKKEGLAVISLSEWASVFFFILLCTIWLAVGGEFRYYIKFLSVVFIYLVVRISVFYLSLSELTKVSEMALKYFIILMALNFGISTLVASPAEREFYNFEHANLLGSYVLLSLVFVYSSILLSEGKLKHKVTVIFASFLSTSTGAFLASFTVFINIKKINIVTIVTIFITSLILTTSLYFITDTFAPELFIKIFGPFQLLISGGGEELIVLSKYRLAMQDLGGEYQSSLVWRFYAYLIFWDFIWEQPITNLILGNGFWGFAKVWEGIAPHNDFLLILIDFGIVGFLLSLFLLFKSIIWCFRKEPVLLPLYLILILRLLFENNIYSYYLLSGLVMNATFLYCIRRKARNL
jgi:hypothetical protein